MERKVGTVSRGIRCPIIREGDNLADIVVNSVLEAAESEGFEIRDRDVISVTESVVARAQGNYAPIQAYQRMSGQSWRRDHRRHIPNPVQKPFLHLLKGNRRRRKEGRPYA